MNIQTLLLFFYLLLPPQNVMQQDLLFASGKGALDTEQKEALVYELETFLNSSDSSFWGSDLSIEALLGEDYASYIPEEFLSFEAESKINEAAYYLKDDGSLKFMKVGEELFSVTNAPDNKTSKVSVNSSVIMRSKLDEMNREVEREVFRNNGTYKNPGRLSVTKYYYRGDSEIPFQTNETNFASRTLKKLFYNTKALVVESRVYNIDDNSNISDTFFSYNNNSLMTQKRELLYYISSTDERRDAPLEKKTIYNYTQFDSPDIDYYEDGVLKRKVVFSSEDSYTESLYFDNGMTVKTLYANGRRKEENILRGEESISRRVFDE